MDEQQEHDLKMAQQPTELEPGSHQRLKALLARKSAISGRSTQSTAFDPIAQAMAQNPGLTRETAEEMARCLGF